MRCAATAAAVPGLATIYAELAANPRRNAIFIAVAAAFND
jgi:hypothetical protein